LLNSTFGFELRFAHGVSLRGFGIFGQHFRIGHTAPDKFAFRFVSGWSWNWHLYFVLLSVYIRPFAPQMRGLLKQWRPLSFLFSSLLDDVNNAPYYNEGGKREN
jgi:hypothetical protein